MLIDISHHKIRYLLVSLGVIWGTIIIGCLLAISNGFIIKMQQETFLGLSAPNVLYFFPGITSKSYRGHLAGLIISPKIQDVINLPKAIPMIKACSVLYEQSDVPIIYRNFSIDANVRGVGDSFAYLTGLNLKKTGVFFTKEMVQRSMRVVVLDSVLKEQLFPNINPIGQLVRINGYFFRVLGYQSSQAREPFGNGSAYIPYTSYLNLFDNRNLRAIIINTLSDKVNILSVFFFRYFSALYHFDPSDKSTFYQLDIGSIRKFFIRFFLAIKIFLGICGFFCLFVGVIGVCNIMFLVVRERRFEIGLKMALGAQPSMILQQFLTQSVVIVCFSGCIGLFCVSIFTYLLRKIPIITHIIGQPISCMSNYLEIMCILFCVSIVTGWLPALRASRMKIVEILL